MRILVVGAGATGGYFGGRLLEAKQDVTFLVRSRRAAELASSGLQIQSSFGDVSIPHPATVLAEDLHAAFDLILLSCKAYDLEGAIESFAPAVGPNTLILPVLNGMRHLDLLDQRFGPSHVLGGLCVISAALEPGGRILHLNDLHLLAFGERDGSRSARVEAIASAFSAARFASRLSTVILQEMWEKWVFIATCAGITCLLRANIGDIVAAGAANFASQLLDECDAIANGQGYPTRPASLEKSRSILTQAGSPLAASMFRDIERHAPVEADHMIGDLLRRGEQLASPRSSDSLLRLAYAHLKTYEARRAREAAQS
jgi:2-dehydropantoate 2-reductase